MPKYFNQKDVVKVQSNKFRNRLERGGALEDWDAYFSKPENQNTAPWRNEEFGNNPYRFAYSLKSQGQQAKQPQAQYQPPALSSNYWLNPTNIGMWYDTITAGTNKLPDWMDAQTAAGVKQLYKYMEMQNSGTDWKQWKPLDATDPAAELIAGMAYEPTAPAGTPEAPAASISDVMAGKANWTDLSESQRKAVLSNPNFYQTGINDFAPSVRDQLRNDPNFRWDQVPKWQKILYDIQSQPLISGAVQGTIMGFGNPGGTLLGAGIGLAGQASGYDPTKEFWQQGDKEFTLDLKQLKESGAATLGLLNYLAEFAEKTVGLGVQAISAAQREDVTLKDVFSKEGWQAGAVTYETLAPAIQAALDKGKGQLNVEDVLKVAPALWVAERLTDLMLNPEKYTGKELVIGAAQPIALEKDFQDRIAEARQRIKNGENYRQVALDFQAGVLGQVGDMAGQAFADPLNHTGWAGSKIISEAGDLDAKVLKGLSDDARAKGDIAKADVYQLRASRAERIAEAFRGKTSIGEAKQEFQARLKTGEVPATELSGVERWLAGTTKEGKIKSLEKPAESGLPKVWEFFASLTPKSRAIVSLNMASENLAAFMGLFDNADDLGNYFSRLQKADPNVAAEIGARMLNAPEWYTIFPAMKNYDVATDVARWKMLEPNINILDKISEVLGETKEQVIRDLSRNDEAARSFERIIDKARTMTDNTAAADLVDAARVGRFSVEDLKSIVKVFHENGAPYTFEMWKAQTIGNMGRHFADWATKFYDVKPEANTIRKMAAILKRAQNLQLLGLNPGNFVQNELGNIFSRLATGNYGYISPKAATEWLERFGFKPARFGEGVGFTGEAITATPGLAGADVIAKATELSGAWKNVNDFATGLNKIGVFGKLNSWVEGVESRNAFLISMRRFWHESWKAGKGFRNMPPELEARLSAAGIDKATVYSMIENGVNMAEVERTVYNQEQAGQARTMLNETARRMGISSDEAIRTFSELGILDELDKRIKPGMTAQQRLRVFSDVAQRAQDMMDIRTAEDIKRRTEHVRNKIASEGALGVVNVVDDIEGAYSDRWINHYLGYGELWDGLGDVPAELRDTMILDYERQNQATWSRTNSYQLANYRALFDGLGIDNPLAREFLGSLGEYQKVYGEAYRNRMEARLSLRDEWQGRMGEQGFWDAVRTNNKTVSEGFETAHKTALTHLADMQKSIAKMMGELYGQQVGAVADEVFGQWVKFREDMLARLNAHRSSVEGLEGAQKQATNAKFYQQDYPLLIEQFRQMKQEGVKRVYNSMNGGEPTTQAGAPNSIEPSVDSDTQIQIRTQIQDKLRASLQKEFKQKLEEMHGRAEAARKTSPRLDAYVKGALSRGEKVPYELLTGEEFDQAIRGDLEDMGGALDTFFQSDEGQNVLIQPAFSELLEGARREVYFDRQNKQLDNIAETVAKADISNEESRAKAERITQRELMREKLEEAQQFDENRILEIVNKELPAEKFVIDLDPDKIIVAASELKNNPEFSKLRAQAALIRSQRAADMPATKPAATMPVPEAFLPTKRATIIEPTAPQPYKIVIDPEQVAREVTEIKSDPAFEALKARAKELREMRSTLFQNVDPRFPPNGYDEMVGGFLPESKVLSEGWSNYVRPILDGMKQVAGEGTTRTFNLEGLDPETVTGLRRYLGQVKGDMASTKLATTRYGEMRRDLGLLNYNLRTPAGEWFDTVFPYRFWGTETMKNWAVNAPDRMAWFANYARLLQFTSKHERDWPERLRGKIRLPAPYLPDWMGDGVYVDPLRQIFQFSNFLSPFQTMLKDKNYQMVEAERILQEWAKDGTYSEEQIAQALQGQGPVFEKAMAEATLRRDQQITGPMDFMNTMFGVAYYLSLPYQLATGQGQKVTETPLLKSTRAFETALKGSPLQALGQAVSLLGKPEEWLRSKAGLPEFGEYGDYYIRRQLAQMVADGTLVDGKLVAPDQANLAMVEKTGPLYDLARERVKQELMMRVPGMSALYAGTHGASLEEMLLAIPESIFGAQLLPEGELRYRGLKEKWNAAWKAYDNGDKQAVQRFFDDHPEYESYLMKNKPPEDALRSFMVGQIWDKYMSLDDANKRVIRGQMGDLFQRAFLDKDTRSTDSIDLQTLAVWARMLNAMVPKVPELKTVNDIPSAMFPQLEGIPREITNSLNSYYQVREQTYPNILALQNMYYDQPISDRYRFKLIYPELVDYWAWRREYLETNPTAAPFIDSKLAKAILAGDAPAPAGVDEDQLRRLLTYYRTGEFQTPIYTAEAYLNNATPIIMQQLKLYEITRQPMGPGAMKELSMIWEENGKPGENLQDFLDNIIIPTLP